jgi:hypothetical protein
MPVEAEAMPRVDLVLVGIQAPASPSATPDVTGPEESLVIVLSIDNEDEARQARRVVIRRLSAMQSTVTGSAYTSRLAHPDVVLELGEEQSAVVIRADLVAGIADWQAILADRDLGFAFWMP